MDEDQAAARTCDSCGASLRPDARFCASCGNWIGAAEPVEEPAAHDAPLPEQAVDEQPAEAHAEEPLEDQPGSFEEWREMEELRALDEVKQPEERHGREEPDEIEEITELHPMTPPPRPGVQPVSLSREPMTRPRRVLLAIALLVLFGAIAVALRTVG